MRRPDVDLCLRDPGFDVDVVVTADAVRMVRIWMGQIDLRHAMRSGSVRLEGPRSLGHALPGWVPLSHFAHVEWPAHAG